MPKKSKSSKGSSKKSSGSSKSAKSNEEKLDEAVETIGSKAEEVGEKVEKRVRRVGEDHTSRVVWALFLIFLGVVFLLNTFGVVPWSVWGVLWRFWPVLVILAGIRIIFGKSRVSGVLVGLVAAGFFGFMILISLVVAGRDLLDKVNITIPGWLDDFANEVSTGVGDEKEEEYEIKGDEYDDIEKREISLDIGAAKFSVENTNDDSYFLVESSYFDNFGEPKITEKERVDKLDIEFKTVSQFFVGIPSKTPEYNFKIGRDALDTTLIVDLGAGDGEVDLFDMNLTGFDASVGAGRLDSAFSYVSLDSMDLDVGAGKIVVRLEESAIPSGEVRIDVGAGKVTLIIPRGVGYRVKYDVGAGKISLPDKEYSGVGGSSRFKSDNYDDAETSIDIVVDVGVGTFELEAL